MDNRWMHFFWLAYFSDSKNIHHFTLGGWYCVSHTKTWDRRINLLLHEIEYYCENYKVDCVVLMTKQKNKKKQYEKTRRAKMKMEGKVNVYVVSYKKDTLNKLNFL